MVKYNVSDLIGIYDFAYAWRVTDACWDKLPEEVLQHIHPLSHECSTKICALSAAFLRSPTNQISDAYQIKQQTSLEGDGTVDHERTGQWLSGLPVHHSECVYVCWSSAVLLLSNGIFSYASGIAYGILLTEYMCSMKRGPGLHIWP